MKHEYLIDLLKLNKTVIVPNIGAFSNNDNPSHPYLFNEFLKFNDGMMAKHISSKEGISMDAAGETIDKFTNELKDILSSGQEIVIPGIGTLLKEGSKTILSHGSDKKETPPTEKKAETHIIEKPIEKKEEPKVEKVIVPILEKKIEPIIEKKIEPAIEKKIEPVVVPVIEKKPEPVVEKKIEPVIEKKIEPIVEKKIEPIVEIKKVEEAIIPKKETPKVKEPKKRKRKLIWIILLLLLLGGGGTAGFLFKDELMKMMGMNGDEKTADKKDEDKKEDSDSKGSESTNENTEPVSTPEIDTTLVEEAPADAVEVPVDESDSEPVKEEIKTTPVVAETSTPGNYYIIVGCYQEQSNADNMISKISTAGLSPSNVGTFSSLIHIAAGSASDMNGAMQTLSSVRGTFPSAWIMKR